MHSCPGANLDLVCLFPGANLHVVQILIWFGPVPVYIQTWCIPILVQIRTWCIPILVRIWGRYIPVPVPIRIPRRSGAGASHRGTNQDSMQIWAGASSWCKHCIRRIPVRIQICASSPQSKSGLGASPKFRSRENSGLAHPQAKARCIPIPVGTQRWEGATPTLCGAETSSGVMLRRYRGRVRSCSACPGS